MTPVPRSPLADLVLLDALSAFADVREVQMPGTVARLTVGLRPVLWINIDSSFEARCWALLDALRVLTLGPEHAQGGHAVRHLYSVS